MPAEALVAYIDKRGGVIAFMPETEDEAVASETPEYKRWLGTYNRAVERGYVGFFESDRICCDLLRVHPIAVFGPDWIDMPEDEALQDRLHGRIKEEAAA